MDVHHAHIWIYPSADINGNKMDFEANAQKIRENI
jgi:hypothetical protein